MMIETSRLILREMNMDDYDALYEVLADSDIMLHYPYTFDEKRVTSVVLPVLHSVCSMRTDRCG